MYSNLKINNHKDLNSESKMKTIQQIISKNNLKLSQLSEENKNLVIQNIEFFFKKEIEYELFEQAFTTFTNKLDNYTTQLYQNIYNDIKVMIQNEINLLIDLIKNDLIEDLKVKVENTLKNELSYNIQKEVIEELKVKVENEPTDELHDNIDKKMREEMTQKTNVNNSSSTSNDITKHMNTHLFKNLITHKLVNK